MKEPFEDGLHKKKNKFSRKQEKSKLKKKFINFVA
jgi:hypothetical protein